MNICTVSMPLRLRYSARSVGGFSGGKRETTDKDRGKLIAKGRRIARKINGANSNAVQFICERLQ